MATALFCIHASMIEEHIAGLGGLLGYNQVVAFDELVAPSEVHC